MSAQPKLVLYTYWRSSSAFRVRIALEVKGLAYEAVFVNLLEKEQKSAAYMAMNPMGHVPCLVVDGRPLVESVAIIELLDEIAPSPRLYPATPWGRAEVRSLVEVVNAGTQPLQNLHVLERVSAEQPTRTDWGRHFVARGLGAFEALAKRYARTPGHDGPFAYGDAFTAADAFLVPQIYNARRFGVDLAPFPRVQRAFEAASALDAVKRASPEAQKDAKP
jgi:maleylacetoacetate isomerase